MKRLDAGISGLASSKSGNGWRELELGERWFRIIEHLNPGRGPRAVQAAALGKHRILDSRKNLLISAPTNGGKSLVGILALLESVSRGQRVVLLEPLRAIAQEKYEELADVAVELGEVLERPIQVHITTGDYRLSDEQFSSPPPDAGEIVVATPERLEAIMRNSSYDTWIQSIGAVCIDEAHLLSSTHRGHTLEFLITSLLCLPTPPRLVLLSASIGNVDAVKQWLYPCDVIQVIERQPPLQKEVVLLQADEDANSTVIEMAKEILSQPDTSLLVFVYQTSSTEVLAKEISEQLPGLVGEGALAYHGRMNAGQRNRVRVSYQSGRSRCVISTTALSMGVNLPATHVIVRDTTFAGVGPLGPDELLQMMGRAGRGDRPGHAVAIVRPNDAWSADELAEALREEVLPELTSAMTKHQVNWATSSSEEETEKVATQVASLLARRPDTGYALSELQAFFAQSLGAKAIVNELPAALDWLTDPIRLLAYNNENDRYCLTALGLKACRAVLPLSLASGLAQLWRDILTIDPTDRFLAQWRPLDHLIALVLLHGRLPQMRRFSKSLVDQVDMWMERNSDQVPLLYREWFAGLANTSQANEVLGSLGISSPSEMNSRKWAYESAYRSTFAAIVLFERGHGKSVPEIERSWGINNFEGIEERWRDNFLWLLSGVGELLDVRTFYYHLKEHCGADVERINDVKRILRRINRQTLELREQLKYCSPLGSVLHNIRSTRSSSTTATIGVASIRKLEGAGVVSMSQLAEMNVNDLVDIGIRRDLAKQIQYYVRRRMQ